MKVEETTILWDKAKLKRFRRTYGKANASKADSFKFDGHEILTAYAKYLIEYLESVLK